MRRFSFMLALSFVSFAMAQTPMNENEAEQFRTMVVEHAKKTKTIVTDFVQHKHLDIFEKDVQTAGKMAFKSPNWVKWEYLGNNASTMIFKGDKLIISKDGKSSTFDLTVDPSFGQLQQLMTNSITGNMFDTQRFKIDYFKTDKGTMALFYPKDQELADFVASFEILFDKNGAVTTVKMNESGNDYTLLVFKNRKENISVPDASFSSQ